MRLGTSGAQHEITPTEVTLRMTEILTRHETGLDVGPLRMGLGADAIVARKRG